MAKWVPRALRRVAPANVLDDDRLSLFRTPDTKVLHCLVVGRALQQDRELAFGFRAINVGPQDHAITHSGLSVIFDDDVVMICGESVSREQRQTEKHESRKLFHDFASGTSFGRQFSISGRQQNYFLDVSSP